MKTKQSRRDFLRLSAAGALGTFALSSDAMKEFNRASGLKDPKAYDICLQLYTIRDAMAKDVPGSLKKVSDIGFRYVELASYADRKFYGYKPSEFRKIVNGLGMEILSSHAQVEVPGDPADNAKIFAEDHGKLGAKYCMQPWIVEESRNSVAEYQKMAAHWNQVGRIMKDNGVQFGYHNHNFEFGTVEGKVPYFDIMLPELDKELVTMELDLFWLTKAGLNPVDIFKKYPGRFQLFHMKDMYNTQAPTFTTEGIDDFAPVGEGVINFKDILAAKEIAGMKYMIVEQDRSRDDKPFEAISTSFTNLTTKILV
jgi:sugar phosphate isomerase/epimerase